MLNFFFFLTMTLFLIVCVFMILLVLIQKGRGGGLASAFGGAGGNTAFGSKTGDVLTWATSVVFGVFLVLAVALNLLATARHNARVGVPAGRVFGTPPAQVPGQPPPARPVTDVTTLPPAPSPPPGVVGAPSALGEEQAPRQEPLQIAPAEAVPPGTPPATQPGATP